MLRAATRQPLADRKVTSLTVHFFWPSSALVTSLQAHLGIDRLSPCR